ncbi:MAG: hypothetical protein AAGH41_09690 [Pseudomonadota bacterium]
MAYGKENPGAMGDAHGAAIVQFKEGGFTSSSASTCPEQQAFESGREIGHQEAMSFFLDGSTGFERTLSKYGHSAIARLCLKSEFPFNDDELRFLADMTTWQSPSFKQVKWLNKLLTSVINEHVEVVYG